MSGSAETGSGALLDCHGLIRPPWFGGLDLRVEAGEIVWIAGPSGSGKTLLLRALADLDPIDGGISVALRLGLGRRLLVASVRSVVQLALLGLVLRWVFGVRGPWGVIGLMGLMALVAGLEAVRRMSRRVRGIWVTSVGVVLGTTALVFDKRDRLRAERIRRIGDASTRRRR